MRNTWERALRDAGERVADGDKPIILGHRHEGAWCYHAILPGRMAERLRRTPPRLRA